LGRGLHESGRAEPELIERASAIAEEFARRAHLLGATHVISAATAALRSAANGAEAAARIGERSGIPVRVLTGEEEARLVYRAVVLGLGSRVRNSQCVVFDLGGGSTEVVSGVGSQAGRWKSLPFGAVTVTERHLPGDPPSAESVEAAGKWVAEQVMHGCALLPSRTTTLAGVGGTVTVLASLARGITYYEPTLIEGAWLERATADALIQRIATASMDERRAMPIMGEGRADIVGAGAIVVGALLERFDATGLICSTQGLRYGLARLAAEEHVSGRREVRR